MVSFSINGLGERGFAREILSVPEFLDFRDQNTVFEDMNAGSGGEAVHGTVAALVLSIGLFACMGPARRAAEVDPYITLRKE